LGQKNLTVVVTDCESEVLPIEERELEKIGARLIVGKCRTEDDVIQLARDADGIMYDYAPITRRVIESLTRCKIIVRYGVGLDKIDLEAAKERRVMVSYLPGWCTDEVSDHAVGLILACTRNLLKLDRFIRSGQWEAYGKIDIRGIQNKTIGLLGFGAIAQQVAKKMMGFDVSLIAYDPHVPSDSIRDKGVEPVDLHTLLRESDVVSIHVPHNPETHHLIGRGELRAMKKTALLINTSRGGVVDEAALVEALKNGWIAGAGLDVLEQEPPDPASPLLGLDNVILTPHVACYSETSIDRMHLLAAQEVVRALKGEKLQSPAIEF